MSEPVTDTDVEDVLASIRRLVSEDNGGSKPAHAKIVSSSDPEPVVTEQASEPPEPEQVEQPASDKLVLTPSLRIMDWVEAARERDENSEDTPPSLDLTEPHILTPDSRADLPAGDDGNNPVKTIEPELSEHSEPEVSASVDPGVSIDLPDFIRSSSSGDIAEKNNSEQDAAEPDEEQVSHSDEEIAEPEVDIDADQNLEEPEEVLQAQVADPDNDVSASDHPDQPPSPDPDSLSAKIAALEAVIGRRQDDWEPDDDGAADLIPQEEAPAIDWEDHAPQPEQSGHPHVHLVEEPIRDITPQTPGSEADAGEDIGDWSPEPREEYSDGTAEVSGSSFDEQPDEAVIDEAALRDMVTEIVRQELQGTLGERITRNVRKLVRREIHRALAARDLD